VKRYASVPYRRLSFWGQQDKLPFDEHWFIALAAPRALISLEGTHYQNVNITFIGLNFVCL
jgi:hypothetical protein